MQCGCVPMVYDTYAAARDMISDGTDGYVIPPFHEAKYAQKLARLMEDDALRSTMQEHAKVASKRFEPHGILDEWEALMKRV